MSALKPIRVVLQTFSSAMLAAGFVTGDNVVFVFGLIYVVFAFFAALMEDEEASKK